MKVGIKKIGLILMLGVGLFFSQLCHAREPDVEPVGGYGIIDWVDQKIVATGVGASADTSLNPAQAKAMAKRAAVVVARRNLLEVVKGIRIDSRTTVIDFAVKDDTITSRVKGVLNNSTIEGYKHIADGTVIATVSMPLSGHLNEILINYASPQAGKPVKTLILENVEKRILELEDRVKALEAKVSGINRLNFELERQIQLYRQFIEAWTSYMASGPHLRPVDYQSDGNLADLKNEIREQSEKVAELTRRFDAIARRLAALETSGRQRPTRPQTTGSGGAVHYTGLVIDARGTEFRPCLKPEIFNQGRLLYPGPYVNLQRAIRQGYVRYYRRIDRAQQSARSGALPFTITAKGIYKGNGALEIENKAFDILKSFIDQNDSFMANGNVVIVF